MVAREFLPPGTKVRGAASGVGTGVQAVQWTGGRGPELLGSPSSGATEKF